MNDSTTPGMHERHLLRKQGNQLFPKQEQNILPGELEQARLQDQMTAQVFAADFQALIQKAIDMESNAASELVLEVKEELDRCYQLSGTLPGDSGEIRQAIIKLVNSIMQAVRNGAGNDAYAQQQLQDEVIAREIHYQLQLNPLITDLTAPNSPIQESELIPALLSETPGSLRQVLEIFDEQQTATLLQDASTFLEQQDPKKELVSAWGCLAMIRDKFQNSGAENRQPQ